MQTIKSISHITGANSIEESVGPGGSGMTWYPKLLSVLLWFIPLAALLFVIGYFAVGDLLSEPLPGIRGGLIPVFLAAGVLLLVFSMRSPLPVTYLVPLYLIAMLWGYFYQLALLWDAPPGASLIRSTFYLLLLLALILFLIPRPISRRYLLVAAGWILVNLLSILGNNAPDSVIMLYIIGVVMPAVFFLALYPFFKVGGSLQRLSGAITIGVVGFLAGLIILTFLATAVKEYGSIGLARNASDLNYAAGVIFLSWPFLFWRLNSRPVLWRVIIVGVTLLACILSFSRTVFVLGGLLAVVTFLRPSMLRNKKFILAVIILIVVLSFFVSGQVSNLWLGRLSLPSWADLVSFDPDRLSAFMSTGRPEIWSFAVSSFYDAPLTGNGLGSFSTLMLEETGGTAGYSGAHSLILTVLAERGLISAIFIAGMLIFIWIKLLWMWRSEAGRGREFFFLAAAGFTCFLVAAHSLGAEMLNSGTMFVHSTISILMMVYLGILLSWPAIKRSLPES